MTKQQIKKYLQLSYTPANINSAKADMLKNKKHWLIPFFNFVDDFRYSRGDAALFFPETLRLSHPRYDALLASTVEALCAEMRRKAPDWVWDVPGLKAPWFVADMENLKAMALAESPVFFRRRKIFVLGNFLTRV